MSRSKYLVMSLLVFALVVNCNSAEQIEKEKQVVVKKAGGVSLGLIITELKEDAKVKEGALVMDVIDDSQAEKAGIQEKDVVVEFQGDKITSAKQLSEMADKIEKEQEVSLKVNRDGKIMDFKVAMKPMKGNKCVSVTLNGDDVDGDIDVILSGDHPMPGPGMVAPKFKKFEVHGGHMKGGFLGVIADDLNESLLEYFEVEYGVLVKEVVEESPAEKAGLKAGDVISKIEGKEIHDFQDLTRTLNYYDPDDEVKIEYSRKGSKTSKKIKLAEKKDHGLRYHFRTGDRDDNDLIWIDEDMGDTPMRLMKTMKMLKDSELEDIEIYII